MDPLAKKLHDDLDTILVQATKHGTLSQLKSVAVYFTEAELRTTINALRSKAIAPTSGGPDEYHATGFDADGRAEG